MKGAREMKEANDLRKAALEELERIRDLANKRLKAMQEGARERMRRYPGRPGRTQHLKELIRDLRDLNTKRKSIEAEKRKMEEKLRHGKVDKEKYYAYVEKYDEQLRELEIEVEVLLRELEREIETVRPSNLEEIPF